MIIEDNIFKCDLSVEVPDEGLAEICFKSMKKFKNNIAQYIDETGEEDTYGDLLQRIIRCAIKMKSKGLKAGDIISVCTHNQKNTCVPWLAAIFIGVIPSPFDPTTPVTEIVHLLKEVPTKIIFVSENAVDLIEKSIELAKRDYKIEIVIFGNSEKYETLNDYLVPNEEENNFVPYQPKSLNDTVIILFSSGTTGLPKGICLRNKAISLQGVLFRKLIMAESVSGNSNFGPSLNYANIFWATHHTILVKAIFSGTSRVIAKEFNPKKWWYTLEKYKVSMVFMNPLQAYDILIAGKPKEVDLSNLRVLMVGGAAISGSTITRLRELLPKTRVAQGYGQTETIGCITAFDFSQPEQIELAMRKPGSTGRPAPGLWIKIVDTETGKALGANQIGELCFKTEYRMNGYYNKDSSDVFDYEGYLKSGDLFYYDDEYCFSFVSRIKELIKYRMIHIAPAAIESILNQHPAIKQAVVIGIPHEKDIERPLAVVQLIDPNEKITAEEIIKYVEERVDDSKRLRGGVRFIKEFPLTPSKKIKRAKLRDMVTDGTI